MNLQFPKRLFNWFSQLKHYSFVCKHIKEKNNTSSDFLSRIDGMLKEDVVVVNMNTASVENKLMDVLQKDSMENVVQPVMVNEQEMEKCEVVKENTQSSPMNILEEKRILRPRQILLLLLTYLLNLRRPNYLVLIFLLNAIILYTRIFDLV